ncbi:MAG: hypothetical protein HS099_15830 [Ardenticatenaceae bacterium]|nr:hypothetical protein [Ardenticatenaceae bacterium]
MSKEQQAQQENKKQAQRPSPLPEFPVAEWTPVQTGLEKPAQLNGLPAVPSSRGIRQATVLRMQQQQGNTAVQRYLARANRSNGHAHIAPAAESEGGEGQEFLGAGAPTLAPSPPAPPSANGSNGSNGHLAVNGVPAIQREEEGQDDMPTEAEKAAALAAARAAEAAANQSANEAHQETAKSQTAKEAEKQVGETAKGKADQAKGEAKAIAASSAANGAAATAAATPASAKPPAAKPAANGASGGPAVAPVASGERGPDYVAPKSPEEDPAFMGVTSRVKETAVAEKEHAPATEKAAEAAAAAEMPAAEIAGRAQNNQAGEMESAPTPDFDAAGFKARLMQRIQEMAPKNAEEADQFKESNKLDGMKGEATNQVAAEKDKSKTPMEEAAGAAPDTGAVPPKPVTPIPDADPGEAPPPLGAEAAVPKEKGVGEVEQPLRESSQSLDDQMADAEVTEEQLANSNEPEFTGALESKKEAQTHAREAPTEVRVAEQEHITTAQTEATAVAEQQTQAMHSDRAALLAQVEGRQETAQTADEQARAKVGADINTIYEETKTNVEAILDRLDGEVERVFSAGAEVAKKAFEDYVDAKMEAYKEERYGGWLGWARWIADKLAGMPGEVNVFYAEGRNLFISKMDAVIDNVVAIIGRGMAEAKAEIANGRKRIQDYIAQLPQDLQAVGQEAADSIQSQFDQLEQSVNDKQNALIDTLASKYQEHLQAVDARIEEMKAANAGLIDRALNAITGVIRTILELKEMLLNVLARAADAIGRIIQDPIGFLGNLINAIKQGFSQFIDNIGTHLQQGFIAWLTGALGGAGITLPQTFDLPGILQLVMQILGISFEQIMGKVSQVLGIDIMGIYGQIMELVTIYQEQGMVGLARFGLERLIGAEGVEALMEVVHIFQVIQSGDFGQLWEIIQQHLSDLKEMIFGKIEEFIVERVIKAGITWLISLFNPAGAFIRACKMIYDVVMFFIERGSQIMSLVSAIIDSITSIASGNISAAASFIEQSLARAIPVAISFLSSLLGLGNISEKVQEIIQAVRTAVDNAIDRVLNSRPVQMVAGFIRRVIGRITSFVQRGAARVGRALGLGGEEPAASAPPVAGTTGVPPSPATTGAESAEVGAGLQTLYTEEESRAQGGGIEKEEAEAIAQKVKQQHPIFTSITPVEGENTWDYEYVVQRARATGHQRRKDPWKQNLTFEITWPKPPSAQYPKIYLGGRVDETRSQSAMKGAYTKGNSVGGYPVKEYSPHRKATLPGGEEIGLDSNFRIQSGTVVGPLSNDSTPGGGKINNILKKYGFSPGNEDLDGDHVWEIQFGGQDVIGNLWPLDGSLNSGAGSKLSKYKVEHPDDPDEVKSVAELKPLSDQYEYRFKITGFDA